MQQTTLFDRPRADFQQSEFIKLIEEKGRDVIYEKALLCPCKGDTTNAHSTCKNCGGSGWIFINPKSTRMVIQGMDVTDQIQGWSEELRGMVRISANPDEKMSFMDRVTIADGSTTIHGEAIQFILKDNIWFVYTAYRVHKPLYVGLYVNDTTALTRLQQDVDYTIDGNAIKLDSTKYPNTLATPPKVTLRYEYLPVFHVIEFRRENMQSFKLTNKETKQILPTSAYARRAHYQLDAQNLAKDRLLNNSYEEIHCEPLSI